MIEKTIIGRAEKVNFPSLGVKKVPAKVDTGADASSIWCSSAEVIDGHLICIFFDKQSTFYTGEKHVFNKGEFSVTRVASSFGHREMRYKVKLPMKVRGKLINATFTLSNRSQKLYPVLIGRSTLRGKYLVDVRLGSPLRKAEKRRSVRLSKELRSLRKELSL